MQSPPRIIRALRLASILAILLGAGWISLGAQEPTGLDILRGRVLGPDSVPVRDAEVTVRVTAGQATRQTTTDRRGGYTVLFPGNAGDYVITVHAVGMAPSVTRVVRYGDEEVLIDNVVLTRLPPMPMASHTARLQEVQVSGPKRPQVGRLDEGDPSEQGSEVGDYTRLGSMPPDPWNAFNPKYYSVFGIAPSNNTLTVNGALVNTILPDAVGLTGRLTTSTSDAGLGGFSGGHLSVFMASGGDYNYHLLDITASPSAFQWVDAASADAGTRTNTIDATLWTFDPLFSRRVNEASSLTITEQTAPLPRLPTSAIGLARLGISADSLQRFLSIANDVGIPTILSSLPSQQELRKIAWLSRIDVGRDATTNFTIVANIGNMTTRGAYMDPSSLATHGGTSQQTGGFLTATLSRYMGNGFLTTLATTVNAYASKNQPYVALPEGRVRVVSSIAQDDSAVTWLTFGGNAALGGTSRGTSWETRASTSWFTFDSRHKYTLGGTTRGVWLRADQPMNALGTFEFPSLAALQSGTASAFTRQTQPAALRAFSQHLDAYFTDTWRVARSVTLRYGLRADLDHATTPAAYNPAVDTAFRLATNVIPHPASVSPRVGMTWQYDMPTDRLPSVVSLTMGRYQSGFSADAVAPLAQSTGLPSSTRYLDCVGTTVPAALWTTYGTAPSSIPTQCADGAAAVTDTIAAPRVLVVDPSYRPASQWRGVLSWYNTWRTDFRATFTYTYGTQQQSLIDRNFSGTAQFTLPSEGNRPVYVPSSAIVPGTGASTIAGSRRVAAYGPALDIVSDLHDDIAQFSIMKGLWLGKSVGVTAQYLYQRGRMQTRGFDGLTAGDPRVPGWSDMPLPRHALNLMTRFGFSPNYALIVTTWLQSGTPYTPMVSGDVNGDGLFNDIAYITNPATAPSSAVGTAMASLLAAAPAQARRCLTSQYGRIAAQNSCVGPSAGGMDFRLELSPPKMPTSSGIVVEMTNAAGGLDQLLHGAAHLHGWGEPSIEDPVLLVVNGFDPSTQQFRYQVNPRFGQRGALGAWRTPVQLRVRVITPVGPSLATQTARTMAQRARTLKGSPEAISRQIPVFNPFAAIVQHGDTIQLTDAQEQRLDAVEARWRAGIDSAQSELARYIDRVADTASDRDVAAQVHHTIERIGTTTRNSMRFVRDILTDDQIARLPRVLRALITGRDHSPDDSGLDMN